MPDANGKMNSAEMEGVRQYLARVWGTGVQCPITHDSNWVINEMMMAPVPSSAEGFVVFTAATYYPVVAVICRTCGYTMFFSAVLAGVVPPKIEASNA